MSSAVGIVIKPILDPLEAIERRGFGRYDVFRDWIDLMLSALQRDDDAYLDTLSRYDRDGHRGERIPDLFATAFSELMAAMEETGRDVLGIAYQEFGMQTDAFGQHFTPHTVAAAMGEIQTATDENDVHEEPVTIADPACGSGRMLVLAARQQDAHTVCFGQDTDLVCAQMAALNLCFFNIDGAVVYGDSLAMTKRRAWKTRGTMLGGEVAEVDPDDLPWPEAAFDEPPSEEEPTPPTDVEREAIEQSELGAWDQ